MFLLRLDHRDIQAAVAAPQDRGHRDAGGTAADDEDLMMLPVRPLVIPPGLLLSACVPI